MDSRIVPALLIAAIALTGTAVGAAVMGVNPIASGPNETVPPSETPGDVSPTPHADPGTTAAEVTAFEQSRFRCASDPARDLEVASTGTDGATAVTVAANFTVSDAGKRLVRPTVEQTGDDEYVLNVTSESPGGVGAQCVGYIRYDATVELPVDDSYTLYVEHDGEIVHRVDSTENGAGASSSTA